MTFDIEDCYLTPREIDIVRILAEGKTTKRAAVQLGISINTVYCTLSRVTRRLKSNKYDLVYKAAKMGVLIDNSHKGDAVG